MHRTLSILRINVKSGSLRILSQQTHLFQVQNLSSIIHPKNLPVISIVGPPNAGKSTLFNRLVDHKSNRTYKLNSKRKIKGRIGASRSPRGETAIVSNVPGTTRDRRECIGRIGDIYFRMMDTAGIGGPESASVVARDMRQQTLQAAQRADLTFLMFDARVGITTDLLDSARQLRKLAANVVVLGNKTEGNHPLSSPVMDNLVEATRLGFGEVIPISAQHGEGVADIAVQIQQLQQKRVVGMLQDDDHDDAKPAAQPKPLQMTILGRQNVGKSTLVNALLRENRVITGDTPGLTRDAISTEWTWEGKPLKLVDTAGIRKRSQRDKIEDWAVQDALRAMKVADVAVLVIDADSRMLHRQELAIADAIVKEGRCLVLVVNKSDLLVDGEYTSEDLGRDVRDQLEARYPFLRETPIVAMSCLNHENVDELIPVVFHARDRWQRVISTGQLNRWLKEVLRDHPPPFVDGRPVKIKYVTQVKGRPPSFLLFANNDQLPVSYVRHLTRHFQDTFEMYGMEVRLALKKSANTNPYHKKTRKSGGSGLGGKEARKKRLFDRLRRTGTSKRSQR